MAMKDDDEECIVNSAGVARYPCMPTEIALQQMRNRMQLAKLGKKLMKWTALASNREMRSLGQKLETAYDELSDKLQDAYIMLARSRYFNPNLNNIVTENVGIKAAVLVETRLKARSGVKVMQQEIKETDYDPYIYLGIEKGGEIITEAKKQWLEIIRMLILIMQLRATFATVEMANKAANKKKNVFTRIIIPRTIETIAYIESGLEELAREDFFRLRRFINKKRSTTPPCQERKPIEIKERLLPRASKRLYKIECFMCGAFLRFSLVDEREKFLERRKVEELRFQMNEMLYIAKKLEEEGIVDINVDEFIVTAEKLKEKLNDSPHIDQLCRICQEILKRKHEKENKNHELQQNIDRDVNTNSNDLKSALLAPTLNEIPKEKNDKEESKMLDSQTKFRTFSDAMTKDLNIKEIDEDIESSKLKLLHLDINNPGRSDKITDTFTEIYRDTKEDSTQLKDRSLESIKKEFSTITITKELKTEPSMYNQTLLDSPLETSIEKIKRVITDEKENKSIVEEKFIITIKEKIKNVIGKITRSSRSSNTSLDELNNQPIHEMTKSTVITIDSRISFDQITSESRERYSGVQKKLTQSNDNKHVSQLTSPTKSYGNGFTEEDIQNDTNNIQTPPPSLMSSNGVLEPKSHEANDFSPLSHKPIENMEETLKYKSKNPTPQRSMSFTDVTISDMTLKDKFKKETFKRSTSFPSVGLVIKDKATTESRTESMQLIIGNDQILREVQTQNVDNSQISSDAKSSEHEEKVHTTCAIQIRGDKFNKPSTSVKTSNDQTSQRRVKINDIKRRNSLPTVSRSCGVTPRGSISHAGICGVYIPPQNPTEIVSGPCICVSSTTLLSTELDSNRD